MSRRNRNRLILAAAGAMAVAVMAAIFCFSQQPGDKSHELSKAVLDGIKDQGLDVFTPVISLGDGGGFHFRLAGRKWAHFYLFAMLGTVEFIWWSQLLRMKDDRLFRFHVRRYPVGAALAFGFCLLYAAADEFHQLFVNSRSGRLGDVFYDSLGFGLSILLIFALTELGALILRRRGKPDSHS